MPHLMYRALRATVLAAMLAFAALTFAPAAGADSPTNECRSAFGSGYIGFKIDDVNERNLNGSYTDPATGFSVTVTDTDSSLHSFSYSSNWPANVVVKGGPSQGRLYSPPSDSGSGLRPPVNPNNGKYYGISHITFCWTPGDPIDPDHPKLKIEKIADRPKAIAGEFVVFSISVKNHGEANSDDVVVSDRVPSGLEIVSVSAPCTYSGQQVTCLTGTLAPGEAATYKIKVKTSLPTTTVTVENEQLTIYKVEKQISMQPGSTVEKSVACNPGDLISDAAVRIDHLDQGTGDPNDIEVHRLDSDSERSYRARVTNHATGQAQLKLFAVCLPGKTSEGRSLTVSAPVTETVTLNPGTHDINLNCPVGSTPIAPGTAVSGGRALILASAPVGDTGRKLTLKISGAATTVKASIRCLDNRTTELNGASSELVFTKVTKPIQVGAGEKATESLICGENAKGIVGGWEFEDGLVPLGNDPQPKSRVFYVWNPTSHPLTGTLYLLCLEARTGSSTPVDEKLYVNTATVSSSNDQKPGAVLSDDASVKVTRAGNAPGPHSSKAPKVYRTKLRGRKLVVGFKTATRSGKVKLTLPGRGKVIGKRKFRLRKAGLGKVRVKIARRHLRSIRKGKVRRVKVKVTSANGKSKVKKRRIRR